MDLWGPRERRRTVWRRRQRGSSGTRLPVRRPIDRCQAGAVWQFCTQCLRHGARKLDQIGLNLSPAVRSKCALAPASANLSPITGQSGCLGRPAGWRIKSIAHFRFSLPPPLPLPLKHPNLKQQVGCRWRRNQFYERAHSGASSGRVKQICPNLFWAHMPAPQNLGGHFR